MVIRDPLSGGFRHFVSSMLAPVASGGRIAGWGAAANVFPARCSGDRFVADSLLEGIGFEP
jgi:hypothetical protein